MKRNILYLIAFSSLLMQNINAAPTNDEVKKTFSQEWAKMSAEMQQKQSQNINQPAAAMSNNPLDAETRNLGYKGEYLNKQIDYMTKEEKQSFLKSLPKHSIYEITPDYITVGGVTNFYIKQSDLDDAKKFFSEIRNLKFNVYQLGVAQQMGHQIQQTQQNQQSYKINDAPVRIHKGMDFGFFTVTTLEKTRLVFKEK